MTYGQTVPLMPFHRACPKLITGSPFPRSLVCCDFFREFTLYRRPTGYRMYRNFLHSRVIYGINGALPLQNIVLWRMPLFFFSFIYFSRLMEEFENDLTFIFYFFIFINYEVVSNLINEYKYNKM